MELPYFFGFPRIFSPFFAGLTISKCSFVSDTVIVSAVANGVSGFVGFLIGRSLLSEPLSVAFSGFFSVIVTGLVVYILTKANLN